MNKVYQSGVDQIQVVIQKTLIAQCILTIFFITWSTSKFHLLDSVVVCDGKKIQQESIFLLHYFITVAVITDSKLLETKQH